MSQMEPAPQHSPALQRALELREEGKSLRVIAGILEAEAVPKPGRVKKWSAKAVARLFAPPAAPSTTPDPAPVAIPAPADAVLTRLAGQIAELEELSEELGALTKDAAERIAEARAWAAEEAERRAQEHERAGQLLAQQAEQTAEWGRAMDRAKDLWERRYREWWAANWRETIGPTIFGACLILAVWVAVVVGLVDWVTGLFR